MGTVYAIISRESDQGPERVYAPLLLTHRLWPQLFSDDAVKCRRGGEDHLPADLLERLCPHGRLKVLRRLPLRDVDEAELCLWVQALMEPRREKARYVS